MIKGIKKEMESLMKNKASWRKWFLKYSNSLLEMSITKSEMNGWNNWFKK